MPDARADRLACRRFTGYKPCAPGRLCEACDNPEPWGLRVCLIALDALGAVIQATSLLPAIHREWGPVTITWVTLPAHRPVFAGNDLVWEVLPYDAETISILQRMRFDIVVNVDKTRRSAALAESIPAGRRLGFGLSPRGQIVPMNAEAEYLYRLGLDDELKFRRNDRPGTRILAEALGLGWQRDPYVLRLLPEEAAFVVRWRQEVGAAERPLVGYNTGCSALFPNKKLTVERHVELIRRARTIAPHARHVLLGGAAETERNRRIARAAGGDVLTSPTTEGLRRGILYVAACDVVVTGDTAALHMAVGLGKHVVAWFGLSCAAEIDLYDRGVKVVADVPCAPCWKRACAEPICLDAVDLEAMVEGIRDGVDARCGGRVAGSVAG